MIIDAHSHMYPFMEKILSIGGAWAKKIADSVAIFRQYKPSLFDVEPRLVELDRYGIDIQLITIQHRLDCNLVEGDIADQLRVARAINDGMAKLMDESKGKLMATATVPLRAFEQDGRNEMERALKGLGLKAVSLASNLNGKPLDLPEFEPFWAYAAEIEVPVYIHPNDPSSHGDRSYEAEYDLMHNFGWPFETMLALSRLVFSGIMERYPRLKIVGHHLGGGIPFFWGRIVETYAPSEQQRTIGRIVPKPLFDYFSLFYYDTAIGGNSSAIQCALDVFGVDRLIFATDAPWGPDTGESRLVEYPKIIRSLGLSQVDNEKIFADNFLKIMKSMV